MKHPHPIIFSMQSSVRVKGEERGHGHLMDPRYSSNGGCAGSLDLSDTPHTSSLADLVEQLPPARYSGGRSQVEEQHSPDAMMSTFYSSGISSGSPASSATVAAVVHSPPSPQGQRERQTAVLAALHMPSSLDSSPSAQGTQLPPTASSALTAGAPASSSAAAGGAAEQNSQSGSVRRSLSMPDPTAGSPQAASRATAHLHPKYAKLVAAALEAEAAGIIKPRPPSRSASPAKAPASPAPGLSRRPPLSKTGSGVSVATPRRGSYNGIDARTLEGRIAELQRNGGGAAAVAAVVRASLADSDAQLLQHATACLSRLGPGSRGTTPRASRRAAESMEAPCAGQADPKLGAGGRGAAACTAMPTATMQAGWVPTHLPIMPPLPCVTAAADDTPELYVHRSSPSCPANLGTALAQQPEQVLAQPEQVQAQPQKKLKRRWALLDLLRRRSSTQAA